MVRNLGLFGEMDGANYEAFTVDVLGLLRNGIRLCHSMTQTDGIWMHYASSKETREEADLFVDNEEYIGRRGDTIQPFAEEQKIYWECLTANYTFWTHVPILLFLSLLESSEFFQGHYLVGI